MKNKKNLRYSILLFITLVLGSCNLDIFNTSDTTDTSPTDSDFPTSDTLIIPQYFAEIGSNTHWFVNDVDTGVVASIHVLDNELSAYEDFLERYPSSNFNEEDWIIALFSEAPMDRHEVVVSFNTKGSSPLDDVTLLYGSKLDLPLVDKEDYYLEGWYQLNKKWTFETYLVTSDMNLVANWIYQRTSENTGLPIFNIDLKGKHINQVNREEYIDTSISITNTGKYDELLDLKANFRGRGHGSWEHYDKKGYRIKFDKKQSLFGEAKSKHWVLVANGHDDSMIRHNLAYTITKETLSYIEYQTSVNVVEVYFNNNYHGVYSLFEHIRVDKDRVNIESEFGVNDTGYLIEYDAYISDEHNTRNGIDYFRVNGMQYPFAVKSPDPDDYLDEGISEQQYRSQVSYIKDYMQDVVSSVLSKNFTRFSELADVNSFVDMYLIHELFKNTDTGWSSFYLYKKPGGKVYCGPAWDFDLSSGISRGDSTYTGFYVSDKVLEHSAYTANELFISLMTQEAFVNLFKKRFLELKWQILNSINNYNAVIQYYEEAYDRDANRWTGGNPIYKSEQTNVVNWLINRTEWLASWAK